LTAFWRCFHIEIRRSSIRGDEGLKAAPVDAAAREDWGCGDQSRRERGYVSQAADP
jgi:hypothetical protein